MSIKHQEHILAMPSALFSEDGSWFPLQSSDLFIAQRKGLEVNPTFRQLLPYGVLVYQGKIGVYQRTDRGNESRLHGMHSIGVGGHVDLADTVFDKNTSIVDLHATLEESAMREVMEEFAITHQEIEKTTPVRWYLVSNASPVDSVHVGLPFIIHVNTDKIKSNEDAVDFLGFFTLEECASMEPMENWSTMLLARPDVFDL